jgi:hypothetical protein
MAAGEVEIIHHLMSNRGDLVVVVVRLFLAVVQALRDKAMLAEVLVVILILGRVAVVLDTLVVILHLV